MSFFLAEKSKKILVLEKIGIIDGYQRPNEKRIVENNDGISTNRQRDKRELK